MMACESRERNNQRGGIFLKLMFLVCFVCLFFGLYLIRGPLLRFAGEYWIVDESPEHSDAIVMLGDDNYGADRATRAAQLYKAGWAPRVVASGRYLRPYASIAELEEHDLVERGVPQAAVLRLAHNAENTRDETAAIAQLMSSKGWKRILLVTSSYHTRRSRYLAERQFPPAVSFTSCPPLIPTTIPAHGGALGAGSRSSATNAWGWWSPCGKCGTKTCKRLNRRSFMRHEVRCWFEYEPHRPRLLSIFPVL